jgi:hypothetical protein
MRHFINLYIDFFKLLVILNLKSYICIVIGYFQIKTKTKRVTPPGFLFVQTVRQVSSLLSYLAWQLKYKGLCLNNNETDLNFLGLFPLLLFTSKIYHS